MQLEAVTAELRPRSDWEAIDLGIALVRRDFRHVLACWWLGMLPALLVACALFHSQVLWFLVLVWWWTPVASRMVLFYLSRHLFGERPTWRNLMHELPRAMGRRFGFRMLLARFSPWRPLTMAVEDLEGLRGKIYAQRVKLLMRRGDSTVVVVAWWRLAILVGLTIAMFQTVAMALPEGQATQYHEFLQEWMDGDWMQPPPLIRFCGIAAIMISMCLTDLFATGIGFGIYVNHRTWIEGWDVEIALRRLGNRLRGVAPLMLVALALLLGAPMARAQERDPREVIRSVKGDKDFEVQKRTIREFKPSPTSSSSSSSAPSSSGTPSNGFGEALAQLGNATGWLILGAAVLALAFLCYRFRHLFGSGGPKTTAKPAPRQAQVVMGMNVDPESLPKDIPAVAMDLWMAGRRQEAMSLLYRGAISRLIEQSQVEIAESDTESDCLRRVSKASPRHEPYFGGLTQVWMRLAYARLIPQDGEIQTLCSTWPFPAPERRPR